MKRDAHFTCCRLFVVTVDKKFQKLRFLWCEAIFGPFRWPECTKKIYDPRGDRWRHRRAPFDRFLESFEKPCGRNGLKQIAVRTAAECVENLIFIIEDR